MSKFIPLWAHPIIVWTILCFRRLFQTELMTNQSRMKRLFQTELMTNQSRTKRLFQSELMRNQSPIKRCLQSEWIVGCVMKVTHFSSWELFVTQIHFTQLQLLTHTSLSTHTHKHTHTHLPLSGGHSCLSLNRGWKLRAAGRSSGNG